MMRGTFHAATGALTWRLILWALRRFPIRIDRALVLVLARDAQEIVTEELRRRLACGLPEHECVVRAILHERLIEELRDALESAQKKEDRR